MPKIQEVANELTKLGFGHPDENIFYLDQWTFRNTGKEGLQRQIMGLTRVPRMWGQPTFWPSGTARSITQYYKIRKEYCLEF